MKKHFLFIIVCLMLCFFIAQTSLSAVSLTLYPTSFKLSLRPGEVYKGSVTAVNPNKFDINIQPEKEMLSGGAEGSIELTGDEQNTYGFLSWIDFSKAQILVKASERYEMPFTITVPANAQPGDHYAAILFRALPPDVNKNSGIGTTGRVGTVILVNVSGQVKKSGIIESIKAPKFMGRGPMNIEFKMNNTGNTFFSPEGRVSFKGLFQKTEISWEPKLVFPDSSRNFKVSWNQRYLFGPFKVSINANVPNGEAIPIKTAYVWAFPWQDTLIISAGLLIILLGYKKFKGKFKLVRVD